MCSHDHISALVDAGLERDQVTCLELIEAEICAGKMRMAVFSHIAVAREVLEGCLYLGSIHSFDERLHVLSHKVGIIRK